MLKRSSGDQVKPKSYILLPHLCKFLWHSIEDIGCSRRKFVVFGFTLALKYVRIARKAMPKSDPIPTSDLFASFVLGVPQTSSITEDIHHRSKNPSSVVHVFNKAQKSGEWIDLNMATHLVGKLGDSELWNIAWIRKPLQFFLTLTWSLPFPYCVFKIVTIFYAK